MISFRYKAGDVVYDCLSRKLTVLEAKYLNNTMIYNVSFINDQFDIEDNCLFDDPQPLPDFSDKISYLESLL